MIPSIYDLPFTKCLERTHTSPENKRLVAMAHFKPHAYHSNNMMSNGLAIFLLNNFIYLDDIFELGPYIL